MFPILVEGPAVEPVPLSEMKAYLRLDDGTEDDLVTGLVKAARLMVEAMSGCVLIAQTWRLMLHEWPQGRHLTLPLSPLIAIDKVTVFDAAGTGQELPASALEVDAMQDPARVWFVEVPTPGRMRNGIAIDFRVGYGAAPAAVPDSLRLAMKILVARWFENRGDLAGNQHLPPDAMALIAPFRRQRL